MRFSVRRWAATAVVATVFVAGLATSSSSRPMGNSRVVVQARTTADAARAVEAVSGRVTERLSIVSGVAASVPTSALATLRQRAFVSPDTRIDFNQIIDVPDVGEILDPVVDPILEATPESTPTVEASPTVSAVDVTPVVEATVEATPTPTPEATPTPEPSPTSKDDYSLSPQRVPRNVGSERLWSEGVTGSGVTVALIDTGVYSHPDLQGRVIHCEDFSGEAGTEAHCADTFGHGTFMAGLIAGNGKSSGGKYMGTAPGARIVSVKLSGFDGSTDVSNVLAGIQWVVAHRSKYNIKVLNLSLGTDSAQTHALSPLNFAVQKAWKAGIVVVVSSGNDGPGSRTVLKPADDPYVITVGASNDELTPDVSDDAVPVYSSRGPTKADGFAKPDVVAPGTHTISLRSPGSAIDQAYGSTAAVKKHYFRGTGTSMAAATATGVIAQMIQASPSASPDVLKSRMMTTTTRIATTDKYAAGTGLVNAYAAARSTSTARANQGLLLGLGNGLGSIENDRGTLGIDLTTPFGEGALTANYTSQYDPSRASLNNLLGLVPFVNVTYTTTGWDPVTWPLTSWATNDWAGARWRGARWRATEWDGARWRGSEWDNSDWSGARWRGSEWNGARWRANSWQSKWYAAAWD